MKHRSFCGERMKLFSNCVYRTLVASIFCSLHEPQTKINIMTNTQKRPVACFPLSKSKKEKGIICSGMKHLKQKKILSLFYPHPSVFILIPIQQNIENGTREIDLCSSPTFNHTTGLISSCVSDELYHKLQSYALLLGRSSPPTTTTI